MATLADVVLTGTAFQSLNVATGLVAGTPLVIQNKGSHDIRIIVASSQPSASSEAGWLLRPYHSVSVQNETVSVWAKATVVGSTPVLVQQLS